jgi:glycerophosphoryl diester phosphodiesterase
MKKNIQMTLIIAHRGARSIAPENTIAAARKAFELGADLWETDVAVTKDEKLILFHDDSLERTTNVKKVFPSNDNLTFTEYTLEQIRKLDTGSHYIETDPFGEIKKRNLTKEDFLSFKAEKVPTLKEALLFTKEKQWKVNLELKKLPERFNNFPVPQKVVEIIRKTDINPDQIIVSSFNHKWLQNVHDMEPGIEIQALIGYSYTDPLDWGDYSFETYNARSILIDDEQIKAAQKKRKKINLFTVNKVEEMKNFMALGIDGIITDYPQRLRTLIDQI